MTYQQQFYQGWLPDNADIEGAWQVKGLLGPLSLRFLGHTKIFSARSEDSLIGNNVFWAGVSTGFFHTATGKSALDPNLDVLQINYDCDSNPAYMRGLTDEVRMIDNDTLLGRGVYRIPGQSLLSPKNIFWFKVVRLHD